MKSKRTKLLKSPYKDTKATFLIDTHTKATIFIATNMEKNIFCSIIEIRTGI